MSIEKLAFKKKWSDQASTLTVFLGTAKIQEGRTSQTHETNSSLQYIDENFGNSFKDFPAALKVK